MSGAPSLMDWLNYTNQGATRSQALSPELIAAMQFLPELGVSMDVFSGGQDGIETGSDQRVGSTRHDHGGAADVFFNHGGRRLDYGNEADIPMLQQIVSRARANGITGIGAGDGYMQPGSMHIGFGDEAVWGAGGNGSNAPDWLRAAFNGTPTGAAPQSRVASATPAQNAPDALGEILAAVAPAQAPASSMAPSAPAASQPNPFEIMAQQQFANQVQQGRGRDVNSILAEMQTQTNRRA